ncbi:MAG: hypothetical protein NTV86_11525 [Planctomycetota bacterium]|nr:hypothetical protein [Planctomycetota bacterium]
MRTIAAIAVLLATTAMAWGDAAEQAKRDFDQLFGEQVHKAKATGQSADDLKLAQEILAAAKGATISPELMTLFCDAAFDLSGSTAAGQEVAAEAASLLAKTVPAQAAHAQRRLLDVMMKQFNSAAGEARVNLGQDCIDKLLALAEGEASSGDVAGASADMKTAERIATQIGAPAQAATIRIKAQMMEWTAGAKKKAASLEAALKAKPDDPATQEALVKVYLLDLDRPAEAAKHLTPDADAAMRTNVPLAVGAAADLAAGPSLELGQWYDGLAGKAADAGVPNALRRARTYYQHFLDLSKDKDAKRLLAEKQLAKVEAALEKFEPKGEWVNVLKTVDLSRHARWGTWAWGGTALGISKTAPRARVLVPVIPDGNYEMMATFSRTDGLGSTRFRLPAGADACLLILGADKEQLCGLDSVDGNGAADNATKTLAPSLAGPAKHTVYAKVVREAEKATITVTLDEKPLFAWSGPAGQLAVPEEWDLSDDAAMGLGASDTRVIYHSVLVRMLTGRLKSSSADELAARKAEESQNKSPRPRVRLPRKIRLK